MKIAFVHDYIKEYGGAERVLEAMHEIWPDAPVYTSVYLPKFLGPHAERFASWKIIPSSLQRLPMVHKLISPIRLLTPWVFEQWDFREFDAIIVSATGAYFPNLLVRPVGCKHICYCHTPPRYLYGYPTARDWKKHRLGRVLGEFFNHFLRQTDFLSYQRPDAIIANSQEVRSRIRKFYHRDASVIYPPVEMVEKNVKCKMQNVKLRKYFLAGGRLARAKHIDVIIEACNRLRVPLKIFGRGFADYDRELHRLAGSTIEFLGEIPDEALPELYGGAKALLFASELEDFGIMPVEAQACGTPVIAYASGGVTETVVDGKTGILCPELSVESLCLAIERFEKAHITAPECQRNAQRFGKKRFQEELRLFVEDIIRQS